MVSINRCFFHFFRELQEGYCGLQEGAIMFLAWLCIWTDCRQRPESQVIAKANDYLPGQGCDVFEAARSVIGQTIVVFW